MEKLWHCMLLFLIASSIVSLTESSRRKIHRRKGQRMKYKGEQRYSSQKHRFQTSKKSKNPLPFSVVIPDQCEEDEEGGMQTSSSVFSVTGFLTFSVVAAQVFVNIINVISEPYFYTFTCICIEVFLQINQKFIDLFNISDIFCLTNSTKLL